MSAAGAGAAGRRELLVALGLAVAGSAFAFAAAGQPWVRATVPAGPLRVSVAASGRALAPAVSALAAAGMAGSVAVLATRRAGRVAVGLLLLVAGAGIAVLAARVGADLPGAVRAEAGRAVGQREATATAVHGTPWPWFGVAGGLALAAAGVLTVVRGRRWPGMSARYDAPRGTGPASHSGTPNSSGTADGTGAGVAADPATGRSMWDALDRGDDPTA